MSGAIASEFLENPDKIFLLYHIDSDIYKKFKSMITPWCVIRLQVVSQEAATGR